MQQGRHWLVEWLRVLEWSFGSSGISDSNLDGFVEWGSIRLVRSRSDRIHLTPMVGPAASTNEMRLGRNRHRADTTDSSARIAGFTLFMQVIADQSVNQCSGPRYTAGMTDETPEQAASPLPEHQNRPHPRQSTHMPSAIARHTPGKLPPPHLERLVRFYSHCSCFR